MAATHDTIKGLLAEFRGYSAGMPASYHVTMSWADFRKMLDRFDAAHDHEIDEPKKRVGNAAKSREALKLCGSQMCKLCKDLTLARSMINKRLMGVSCHPDKCKPFQAVHTALAAPPRNCDIHTDFNDAITTLADKRNWHDGRWDSERYCILASWLLATATEKEGGNK